MKAITICQPYAHLIATGEKWVENRRWQPAYVGCVAIHAGKSRTRLRVGDEQLYPDMPFGAIVAVGTLVGSILYSDLQSLAKTRPSERPSDSIWTHAEIAEHAHTEGPCCWLLQGVIRLAAPITCFHTSGFAYGFWEVPPHVEHAIHDQFTELIQKKIVARRHHG